MIEQMKNHYLLSLIAICILFIFLRLFQLNQSLLFFNDIGRDYWVLFNWQQSWKPPLLGPQTSALPYNQSAVYFYLLMPMFLLTGQSPYSSVLTLIIFYLLGIGLIYKLTKNNKQLQLPTATSLLIISLHPQVIIQNRFVWNPSFLPILILISLVSWLLLLKKWKLKYLLIVTFSISLATSLNYSAGPALVAFIISSALLFRSKIKTLWFTGMMVVSVIFWNIPTLVFELRHHFLLTNLLITGEKLSQTATSWYEKTLDLISLSLMSIPLEVQIFVGAFLVICIGIHCFSKYKLFSSSFQPIALLLVITVLITLAIPISIQAHYIFAFLTITIFLISSLKKKLIIPLACLLIVYWIRPTQLNIYFSPAYRSFSKSLQCAQKICDGLTVPVFLSVQSDIHPYHNGMEWKYLLARSGCVIKELDTQVNQANTMVVIIDHSNYEHGKTTYNELTQFGESKLIGETFCSDNLRSVIIQRI